MPLLMFVFSTKGDPNPAYLQGTSRKAPSPAGVLYFMGARKNSEKVENERNRRRLRMRGILRDNSASFVKQKTGEVESDIESEEFSPSRWRRSCRTSFRRRRRRSQNQTNPSLRSLNLRSLKSLNLRSLRSLRTTSLRRAVF
jgi:hypothetical protein